MRSFYLELIGGPTTPSKAEALQQAQRKLLELPAFRHPAYWGPFLLIGDGI